MFGIKKKAATTTTKIKNNSNKKTKNKQKNGFAGGRDAYELLMYFPENWTPALPPV